MANRGLLSLYDDTVIFLLVDSYPKAQPAAPLDHNPHLCLAMSLLCYRVSCSALPNLDLLLQAKQSAYEAAKAGAKAAKAALEAVEHNVNVYVQRKDYLKLKDIAEASDIAGKVCLLVLQCMVAISQCQIPSNCNHRESHCGRKRKGGAV
jgi:hypothetical protein